MTDIQEKPDTVPGDEFSWDGIEASAVERLRERGVQPVPAGIIRQAQRALDGVPHPKDPAQLVHTLEYEFPTEEKAAEFARHIRNAGAHTTPACSISPKIDPERKKGSDEPVNPRRVRWHAGPKRGAKPKGGQAAAQ